MDRIQGTVKWVNLEKLFGFLTAPPEPNDIFCDFDEIQGGGSQVLSVGQEVEFELVQGPKGPKAVNVVVLT